MAIERKNRIWWIFFSITLCKFEKNIVMNGVELRGSPIGRIKN